MRFTTWVMAGALALLPARSSAQVSGAVVIGGGPIGGVVTFGHPVVVRPRGYVVVPRYYPPARIVVVERYRKHRGHHWGRNDRRVVYYDRGARIYYDRYRPGLYEVPVYYRDGHYYGECDRDHYRDRDRYYDRDDRYRGGDDDDWDRDR
jgi:hypothetical protein